jgi:hypothetical protein
MRDQDQPRTAASQQDAQRRVMEAPEATARSWAGLTDTPTSPRENQPADSGRMATAREDFERVLGH